MTDEGSEKLCMLVTAELKQRHVGACEEHLRRLKAEGDGFLSRIVTGDETWVHYHQPETNITSKDGVIPHHQNPRSSRRSHLQGRLCSLSFGMNEA
jgi:hypothetical protein